MIGGLNQNQKLVSPLSRILETGGLWNVLEFGSPRLLSSMPSKVHVFDTPQVVNCFKVDSDAISVGPDHRHIQGRVHVR